jgi:NADH-quinone oxidoreductase subunit G
MMGFKYVYDTCFTADMTIWEEANEFIDRLESKTNLPLYTSCCPAWVKYAEIYFPELLNNLSSCRSPQQMFGAVAKTILPEQLGIKPENIVVVSIMPCSAKKYEAQLPKFVNNNLHDVDYVLTTVEIGRMINSMGIKFEQLESAAFDMPFGFATGAGMIFGTSGGVAEAALRYVSEKLTGKTPDTLQFKNVRGTAHRRESSVNIADKNVNIAIVHGLENARKLILEQKAGKCSFDFIEVMACPGGCIAGAGQPITHSPAVREQRRTGIFHAENNMQLQKSQDNYMVEQCYCKHLGGKHGSAKAHHTLHTCYTDRSSILNK